LTKARPFRDDFATLFIDGAAVAEVTAAADAARPLVASIGRLPLASPQRAHALPLMAQEAAQQVVSMVAGFVNHGFSTRCFGQGTSVEYSQASHKDCSDSSE
jgi:hypothetical protein